MDTFEAIRTRNSVRAFLPRQLSRATIEGLIERSLAAPSACNIQPFCLALAMGQQWRRIREELVRRARSERIAHELPWSLSYPERYRERQRSTGFGLYRTLGIRREDRAARERQFLANYRAFGAPAVLFVFTDREVGEYATLDLGIWIQTFMLLAHAAGLGTVAQTSLAAYPQVVRQEFDAPQYMALACGIALGHPDPGAAVNGYRPDRAQLKELLLQPRECAQRAERELEFTRAQRPCLAAQNSAAPVKRGLYE